MSKKSLFLTLSIFSITSLPGIEKPNLLDMEEPNYLQAVPFMDPFMDQILEDYYPISDPETSSMPGGMFDKAEENIAGFDFHDQEPFAQSSDLPHDIAQPNYDNKELNNETENPPGYAEFTVGDNGYETHCNICEKQWSGEHLSTVRWKAREHIADSHQTCPLCCRRYAKKFDALWCCQREVNKPFPSFKKLQIYKKGNRNLYKKYKKKLALLNRPE